MAKRLTAMTTEEVIASMSIAGDPEKIGGMFKKMQALLAEVDRTNAAELTNIIFALDRVKAEAKMYLRWLEKKTGQKY